MKTLVFKLFYVVLILLCVMSASAKDNAFTEKVSFLYNQYIQNCATNVNVLLDEFTDSQINSMPMIAVLPGYTNYCGLKVFIPSNFPKDFYDNLISIKTNNVDIYRIYIKEDSNADRVFMNSNGIEIARYKHPYNYTDSSWYLKNYLTEVYKSCSTKEDYQNALSMYNPTKYCRSVDLIESTNLVTYLALEIQNTPPVLPVVYKSSITLTNIQLEISASINTNSPNEKIISVNYPPDDLATNSFTLYTTTNLFANWSRLCITNLDLSTNVFYYTDTETNSVIKYYKLYLNVDTDLDGLFDGDEKLIYGTSSLKEDSDGDFIPDKWEIDNGLDPLLITDAFADFDRDMLPNSYEYFHGLNPNTNDSWQITKLRVDPENTGLPNTYETIQDAFDASTNYSIIEVAQGIHDMDNGIGASFPSHPVMLMSDNWGTNRLTIIDLASNWLPALALTMGQDNRTIIKGLTIRLKNDNISSNSYQIAIYMGSGVPNSCGATPVVDGIGIVLGPNRFSYGLLSWGTTESDTFINNCYFAGRGSAYTRYIGILSFGGSNLKVYNNTFLNFDSTQYSAGIHLEPIVAGSYTLSCDIFNSVWDDSFDVVSNNVHAVGALERIERLCNIALYDSIMPEVWSNTVFELEEDLTITNLDFNNSYYLTSNSICINSARTNVLTWYDFEGHERTSISDIGADEFYGDNQSDRDNDTLTDVEEVIVYMSSPFDIDTDGDGLTDPQEANVYTTLLYRVDTDGDNVSDYDEVVNGTDPLNSSNYCFIVQGSVTNETFYKKSPYYMSYSFEENVWDSDNMFDISDTNGYRFVLTFTNTMDVWLQTFYDFNTNNIVDELEPFSSTELNVSAGTATFDCKLTLNDFDLKDGDGMADLWEEQNGLCWTNSLDVYDDPDNDGIDNGWEFELNHNPNVSNSTNYAITDAKNSIIPLLENKNPTNSLCLFVDPYVNPTPTNYVRNTNCWAADIDLTALSPWNSKYQHRLAGTLISPRHVIMSAHFYFDPPYKMHFIDNDNILYERTFLNGFKKENWTVGDGDFAILVLDEDLPTNHFKCVEILSDDYKNYLDKGQNVQIIKLDKEEKVLLSLIESIDDNYIKLKKPVINNVFYENSVIHDSGNPGLIMIKEQAVLLTVVNGFNQSCGPFVQSYKDEINIMMEDLSNSVGITNGYQLKEVDLSEFDILPNKESRLR